MTTIDHQTSLDATSGLLKRYRQVRDFSERIRQPLSPEDCMVQSMPDVSPTRWHLAHTTWFFEQFVLSRDPEYRVFDQAYGFLFNSYYNTVGKQFPRPQRGLISRPGLADILNYRRHVDSAIEQRLQSQEIPAELLPIIEIGLQHEQQHQELMLTDIKHVLACNPTCPAYRRAPLADATPLPPLKFVDFEEGIYHIGYDGDGFAFDHERPRHRVFCDSFAIANRPITCGEFLQFIEDGGYRRPELWLSLGWQTVQQEGWNAPLYWIHEDGQWQTFTLAGRMPLDLNQPVCHVSYFEADAYARWAGCRLPTEAEWEVAAAPLPVSGLFADRLLADDKAIHPVYQGEGDQVLSQLFGSVWEWTSSPYTAYPGYRPPAGALGEYNGKFQCNQFVLRGGSCASPSEHLRATYRNFFPPHARWQFSGIRLASSPSTSNDR
ncbi:MAG: ergothioneine biosynthesis protein EgtB [Pirellulaceae bacterium]|nr:MAG: ergothioneine biosynthesis protein EgtB [Pirellulaceae bacterium]